MFPKTFIQRVKEVKREKLAVPRAKNNYKGNQNKISYKETTQAMKCLYRERNQGQSCHILYRQQRS